MNFKCGYNATLFIFCGSSLWILLGFLYCCISFDKCLYQNFFFLLYTFFLVHFSFFSMHIFLLACYFIISADILNSGVRSWSISQLVWCWRPKLFRLCSVWSFCGNSGLISPEPHIFTVDKILQYVTYMCVV